MSSIIKELLSFNYFHYQILEESQIVSCQEQGFPYLGESKSQGGGHEMTFTGVMRHLGERFSRGPEKVCTTEKAVMKREATYRLCK